MSRLGQWRPHHRLQVSPSRPTWAMRSAASNGNASKSRPGETDPDLICSAGCPAPLLPGATFISSDGRGAHSPLPPCANLRSGNHKTAFVVKPVENLAFYHKTLGLNRNCPGHSVYLHGRRVLHRGGGPRVRIPLPPAARPLRTPFEATRRHRRLEIASSKRPFVYFRPGHPNAANRPISAAVPRLERESDNVARSAAPVL